MKLVSKQDCKRILAEFKRSLSAATGVCILLTTFGPNLRAARVPRRIIGEINDNRTFRVVGNTRPMLSLAQDEGEASSAQTLPRMSLHFAMSTQQAEDLDALLRQQQAPDSAQYHKFLTPEEYADRFGLNGDDLAKVTDWLSTSGFSDIQVARSRTFVSFGGDAGLVQAAFHTSIHRYSLNGETHYANTSDPLLPTALEGTVQSVRGLHNFRMRPRGIRKPQAHFTSSISGNHFIAPDDFATIYNVRSLYRSGIDGTGVKIAVVGQSDIQLSDIRAFRAAAGLPANDPTIILTGTDPGVRSTSGDERESDLDVEWAGAIARNANIVFVTSTNVDTSITYAIDNNIAPIVSVSYGLCESEVGRAETNTEASLYQQANAQGMTVLTAAGDSGAADCDTSYPARRGLAVDVPSSLPYVTSIGGTTLSEGSGNYWNSTNNSLSGSAVSYIPEGVWNDSASVNSLSAGGGGASIYNAKPSWQVGNGVPNDGARDVPDLAFAASPNHDGFLVCSDGDCVNGFRNTDTTLDVVGGTSCGAPAFAGIVALMVQAHGAQGNINPHLYSLAASSTDVFHDTTSGTNAVACRTGTANCTNGTMGFSAAVGYDQATGWGSVDASHLVSEWGGVAAASVPTTQGPLSFVPVTPCRLADTRETFGAFGGSELPAGSVREFDLPASNCSIPNTAVAYALNVTVVPNRSLSYLSLWPSGQQQPFVSTLNSDGRVKANAAIVPAGVNGGVNVYVTDQTHFIMDITGYFVPFATSSGMQFFPLTPCRVADTRGTSGALGGPFLSAGQARDFPILSSACNVPSGAQAYSLNFTVVPREPLNYLAGWATGQGQPPTSIVNASTGTVTANAAIVPAGANGSITTFASNNTDVVIDINGYFAPPASGGSYFYTLAPCRVIDTRNPAGSLPFSGALPVDVKGSGCGAPSSAQAYALNATVVPSGILQYLTLWPNGQPMPVVSTLNADPATVTSNMALLPTTDGLVNAFASEPTYLILDIAGYFARDSVTGR
ncbi:MAG: protease pro-enzyme activation domain-containing protein [Bryobacteraceae bacterium]